MKQFSLQNGWDLTLADHQSQFLRMTDVEEPDDIWMSPMCGPWSQMQEMNCLDQVSWDALEAKR